jgi:hypothetical protein
VIIKEESKIKFNTCPRPNKRKYKNKTKPNAVINPLLACDNINCNERNAPINKQKKKGKYIF